MAALVQAKANEAANALSVTASLTSAVTAGNLIVVGVYAFGETTGSITVTDTLGNVYTKVLTTWQNDSSSDFQNLYYCVSASGGTNAVKAQGPSSTGFWGIAVAEISGMGGAPTLHLSGGNNGTHTTSFSGPAFTPNAGELLVAFYGDEGNSEVITTGNGWTQAASSASGSNNNALSYFLSAAGTLTHSLWTNSGTAAQASVYATFTPATSGPSGTGTVAEAGALSGSATILIPSPLAALGNLNTLAGSAVVLVPSPTATLSNIDALSGSPVVLIPASGPTLGNTNSLAGIAAILKPSGTATLAGVGALSGTGVVLVPAGAATVAETGALAGAGVVMVPSGASIIGNINAISGASSSLVAAPPGTVSNVNSLSGSAAVLIPAATAQVSNTNTVAGSAVVLVPSAVQTLANVNTLSGAAVVLSPAPAGVLANANTLAGSGVVLVPSGNATFANTNSLNNSGAAFVASPPGTLGNINALAGIGAVLVPSASATLAGVSTLAGAGGVLVPSGVQTLSSVGALSGSGLALVVVTGTVAAVGGVSGSGVVLVPAAPATVAGVGALFGQIGPVILSFYALYRAKPRPNLYRASSRISRYVAAPRRNLYRAKGAVGMSALQDSGQQNSVLRVGEQNQPYLMDFKTVPLGTGEHVTACGIVVKQVTDTTSTDVTSALCPVQPTSGDIVNDVVSAYLNGGAATVGAKYKVIYYATTNATKQPTVRVEDISFVQCDE